LIDFYNVISPVANGNVYALIAPSNAKAPYVVYTPISISHRIGLNKFHGVERVRVQVDAFAKTYAEALALQAQIMSSIVSEKETVVEVSTSLTEYEPQQMLFRVSTDYSYDRYVVIN
jgi:hypothetical protein